MTKSKLLIVIKTLEENNGRLVQERMKNLETIKRLEKKSKAEDVIKCYKKAQHVNRVSICRRFSHINCPYSDVDCLFDHSYKACNKTEFNCKSCDKERSEFMKHRRNVLRRQK